MKRISKDCTTSRQWNIIQHQKEIIGVPILVQRKQVWVGTMRLRFDPWPRSVGWGSCIAVSCVGCRRSSDLMWLWLGPAAAAPIRPLVWESLYAEGVALKSKKKKKKRSEEINYQVMKNMEGT